MGGNDLNSLIKKHLTSRGGLKEISTFDVEISDDKRTMEIMELCDMVYVDCLNKSQVLNLINDMIFLYGQMVEDCE